MPTGLKRLGYLWHDYYRDSLSQGDFIRLRDFIHSLTGIKMDVSKTAMLESRIRKRLINLNLYSFRDYCEYLFSPSGSEKELVDFIDVITTNKTDFFREPDHFDYLVMNAIPELINENGGDLNKLNLWSAACSRGNEAYTIAIVVSEFLKTYPDIKFDFSILATDICTNVIEEGKRAIYSIDEIEPVPAPLRKRYFMKSRNPDNKVARVVPELRDKVNFKRLNLMDNELGLQEKMDVIFCRNVYIYFDKKTQDDITFKLCRNLKPNGYLFMGHSEMLDCRCFPLISTAPAVYKKISKS